MGVCEGQQKGLAMKLPNEHPIITTFVSSIVATVYCIPFFVKPESLNGTYTMRAARVQQALSMFLWGMQA